MSGVVMVLGGPTAAGKSSLGIELALKHDAVIVSADAMTVYRGLDVGTAKPTEAERALVPHYGIDVVDPTDAFSVADLVDLVASVRDDHARVLVVGGTPFYLRALVDPLADLPAASPEVRSELELIADLHAALEAVDPQSAARLHPNDRVRLVRALEVHRLTGSTLTELHAAGTEAPAMVSAIGWLDRDDLQERIAQRLRTMFDHGYVAELQAIVDGGCPIDARPLKSFAYRHLVDHLAGTLTLGEAMEQTRRATWRLARKQRGFARGQGWAPVSADEVRALADQVFGAAER